MASTHKHIRSSTADKRPTTAIADGQVALNTNAASPGLFFKDSTGASIIKIGPVHVGSTAPNATPGAGGSAGNSTGEVWLDNSLSPVGVKIWDGSAWVNATPAGSTTVQGLLELATDAETQAGSDTARAVTSAGLQSKVSDSTSTTSSTTIASSTAVKAAYDLAAAALPLSGGIITGNLEIGTTGSLSFEGSTADAFETTIAVTNPTADRTITLPDQTGNFLVSGNASIVNADVNASAAIAGTKISPDFGSQNVTTTGTVTGASLSPTSSSVPTNGVYLPAANSVAVATNGTGRLFIDSTGLVGVGTSSPTLQFEISNGTNTGYLHPGIGTGLSVGTKNSSSLSLDTNNTTRVTVTSAGLVGIGTSPSSPLHVYSVGNTEILIGGTSTPILNLIGGAATDPVIGYGVGALRFGTTTGAGAAGFSEKVRIDTSGRVGVGTTSPATPLHVVGTIASRNTTAGMDNMSLQFVETGSGNAYGVRVGQKANASIAFEKYDGGWSETARIDSGGRLGIGTSSPANTLHVNSGAVGTSTLLESTGSGSYLGIKNSSGQWTLGATTTSFILENSGGTALTVDSSRRVGIGTTSPAYKLDVTGGGIGVNTSAGTTASIVFNQSGIGAAQIGMPASVNALTFETFSGSSFFERARIDSSGRLLVGTSSARSNFFNSGVTSTLQVDNDLGIASVIRGANDEFAGTLVLGHTRSTTNTIVQSADAVGSLSFQGNDGTDFVETANISAFIDGTPGANDMPGRLVFSTTADGASSPTERMRIGQDGVIGIGQYTFNAPAAANIAGIAIGPSGYISVSRSGDLGIEVNRISNDGNLVRFLQGGTEEGSISVSGTTVSYNGAHLSRWSQLPSGAEREEILRGSVLSNIDEMCEWGEEDNEQLNRMKVSDVEGDKNVAGVFQCWDDDDDTYTNDFYCAMTGDFIIRIAADTTVERGDLLISAGDGTAKPQDDDIIRSKTIAKVTSTTASCTYDDGSYCVPCVLMAC